jgi:tight adherence protein B
MESALAGPVIGALGGLGLLLIAVAFASPHRPRTRRPRRSRLAELLAQAGAAASPSSVVAACLGALLTAWVLVTLASSSVVIGLAFATFAGYAPVGYLRSRARRRSVELREVWPDAVDNLASAVRAGLSLSEALSELADTGPVQLRPAFSAFAEDYRATGRLGACLDRLKARLADPTGDRVVEAVRLAREVGGTDLGRLLRTLSDFLREDVRIRAEIATRQGWTVNAARLALAAPWIVLGLFALRPASVAAYDSAAGFAVLLAGGAISLLAYRLMLRIARLPSEQRVLR